MSNNSEYKYHLATWHERDKTLRCPGCGKSRGCFKEYVDDEGNPVDPTNHTCGKCDHETSCGYHLTPKEFFKANGRQDEQLTVRVERPQRRMIVIDRKWVAATMKDYERNGFVRWLYSLPWDEEQRECLNMVVFMYVLGTSKDGGVIYWQVDEQGRVRTGKKMLYDETGHRLKDEEGNSIGFNWIHSMMQRQGFFPKDKFEMMQCLFGQHLIQGKDPKTTTIHIVESEKTAVLMAMFDSKAMDTNLWLACGGLYNLNPSKLQPFDKFKIYVYPDANGVERWKEQVKNLPNVTVETKWMKGMTAEDPKGADIADILLRRMSMTDEARLEEMKRNYPQVKRLIEDLKLTLKKK